MNQQEDLARRVCKVIAESLCVDHDEVTLASNLMNDLGAESIDFLDIMFRLEKEFSVKIPQREIERQGRGDMAPEEFEIDGVLQPKGLARMKELIPEIPNSAWREEMALRELPSLFTVGVFIGIVQRKLDGTLFGEHNPHTDLNECAPGEMRPEDQDTPRKKTAAGQSS